MKCELNMYVTEEGEGDRHRETDRSLGFIRVPIVTFKQDTIEKRRWGGLIGK